MTDVPAWRKAATTTEAKNSVPAWRIGEKRPQVEAKQVSEVNPIKRHMGERKSCPGCGKVHSRHVAKYCSDECRRAFRDKVVPAAAKAKQEIIERRNERQRRDDQFKCIEAPDAGLNRLLGVAPKPEPKRKTLSLRYDPNPFKLDDEDTQAMWERDNFGC